MAIEIFDMQRAQEITDAICHAADELWSLLLSAYEGRAWEALGYLSWEQYITTEFDMSRRHGYRLLDHGRVLREIETVSGVCPSGHITEAVTRDLKPHLEVVKDAIRTAVEDVPPERIAEVVAATVEKERARIIQERQEIAELNAQHDPGPEFDWARDEELIRQEGAIRRIASELCQFPPPEDFVRDHPDLDLDTVRALYVCRTWLDSFITTWEER